MQVRDADFLNILLDITTVREAGLKAPCSEVLPSPTPVSGRCGNDVQLLCSIEISASTEPSQKDWGTSAFGGDETESSLTNEVI